MTQLNIQQKTIDFNIDQNNKIINDYLLHLFQQQQYEDFWYLFTKKSKDKTFLTNITLFLNNIFNSPKKKPKNKNNDNQIDTITDNNEITQFLDIEKNKNFPLFIEGFSYFLEQQTYITSVLMKSCLEDSLPNLINHFFTFKKYEGISKLMQYVNNRTYSKFASLHQQLIHYKDSEGLCSLYSHISDLKENTNSILSLYGKKKFFDFPSLSQLVTTHKLDINCIIDISYESLKLTFLQYILYLGDINSKDFIENIFKNYGKQIDLEYVGVAHGKKFTLFDMLKFKFNKDYTLDEHLDYYNNLILYTKLKPQHFSYICSEILQSYYIKHDVDHIVYSNLFKNGLFNSENFDRSWTLIEILNLDTNNDIAHYRVANKNQFNPIKSLLKNFFTHANLHIKIDVHPFIYWSVQKEKHSAYQSNLYSKDTFDYLYHYYKEDLLFFDYKKYSQISQFIAKEMEKVGYKKPIQNLQIKKGFINKLFGFKEEVPLTENEKNKQEQQTFIPKEINFSFNDILLEQIKDQEIKHYISSIQLNAEQLITLIKVDVLNEDSYYINTLLPKFVNKTIENYLNFETIDPQEAKNNVLTQLKLLNKKTFELLSKELNIQKEDLERNNRIQNRMINR